MIGVAGATGPFRQRVLRSLLARVPARDVVVAVRSPLKAAWLAAQGVHVRLADDDRPATLQAALAGVERLLLVSSGVTGGGVPPHQAWIEAARRAGVRLLACTSVLHADTSPLATAAGHRQTEADLQRSGLPWLLLRHGCCVEHYTAGVPAALAFQVVLGSAGAGCISCASCADYAEAAAAVLAAPRPQAGHIHELVGGSSFNLPELAAEIAHQSGREIRYLNLPARQYAAALQQAGVPAAQAAELVDIDRCAAGGALLGFEADLERLIGRPAMRLPQAVALALQGCLEQAAA